MASSSTGNESDESDEIPSDVDLSDPFFSQELDTGISNKNKSDKASTGKTKKKRKRTAPETEEDRKAKVSFSSNKCSVRRFVYMLVKLEKSITSKYALDDCPKIFEHLPKISVKYGWSFVVDHFR